ncbi:hypothetical protein CORC01_04482, partial [Colletotrichum orchidophilum]
VEGVPRNIEAPDKSQEHYVVGRRFSTTRTQAQTQGKHLSPFLFSPPPQVWAAAELPLAPPASSLCPPSDYLACGWLSLTSPYFHTARPDYRSTVAAWPWSMESESERERGQGRGRCAWPHDGNTCHPVRTEDGSTKYDCSQREGVRVLMFRSTRSPGHMQLENALGTAVASNEHSISRFLLG